MQPSETLILLGGTSSASNVIHLSGKLLMEAGTFILLEDGTSKINLE